MTNISKNLIRAATHLVLEGEPVSPSEIKEMALRHVLSSPCDKSNGSLTRALFDSYITACDRSGVSLWIMFEKSDVVPLYKAAFVEGFLHASPGGGVDPALPAEDFFLWPSALPEVCPAGYPRELIIELGNTLGYKAGLYQANLRGERVKAS